MPPSGTPDELFRCYGTMLLDGHWGDREPSPQAQVVMPKLARPAPGDIVVRQKRREQVLVYILHTASGPDQLVLRSREEAVERATLTAHRHQIRAWLTVDGQDHTPLEQRASVKSSGSASRSMPRRL